jgi:mitochondrial import inner membrane translocase subunit TIM17
MLSSCRILDDIGGAFGMGGVGGGLWHLMKGMKNSPGGARFRGGIEVRLNVLATYIC